MPDWLAPGVSNRSLLGDLSKSFRCPSCQLQLEFSSSYLSCPNSHRFEYRDGYLDASIAPTDARTVKTFESFGYEWNTFDDMREEDKEFWNSYTTGVPFTNLQSKIGLDAGCGKGRYSRFLSSHVGLLVALDGSSSVVSAARNLNSLGNVVVIKGDLRNVPFADETFNFIMSLGVLHHLDNPYEGFTKLVNLLRPDGMLFLYLYSAPEGRGIRQVGLAAAREMRRVTTRLPFKFLRALCLPLAAILRVLLVIPGEIGDRRKIAKLSSLPLTTYRTKSFRSLWLDTFDRLSAPIEHRYRWHELQSWFDQAGLNVESVREDAGWYFTLRKDVPLDKS